MAQRLLGLGDDTVDTYVDRGLQFPGSNAVNVAVQARRLGAETGYLGCLGSEEAGMVLGDALKLESVDTKHCRIRLGPNARAFIGHDSQDRCFLRSERGVRGEWVAFDAEDRAYIAGYDLVPSGIYSELGDALPVVRSAARSLSYDFSERWTDENLAATLPAIDTAFLSYPSASDAECCALMEHCIGWGAGMVVATHGVKDALALAAGGFHQQAARSASVADTLGAADGFIAACLLAILGGAGIAAALAARAEHAAWVCGYQGGFGRGVAWAPAEVAVS